MTIIQRTPNLGIGIRLQPVRTEQTPVTSGQADPQVMRLVWSAYVAPMEVAPPRKGNTPGSGDWARLHEWKPGDEIISPISLETYGITVHLIATVHGMPDDAEIEWSIVEDTSGEAAIVWSPTGASAVLRLQYAISDPEGDPFRTELRATVNSVIVGSVVLYWTGEYPH